MPKHSENPPCWLHWRLSRRPQLFVCDHQHKWVPMRKIWKTVHSDDITLEEKKLTLIVVRNDQYTIIQILKYYSNKSHSPTNSVKKWSVPRIYRWKWFYNKKFENLLVNSTQILHSNYPCWRNIVSAPFCINRKNDVIAIEYSYPRHFFDKVRSSLIFAFNIVAKGI